MQLIKFSLENYKSFAKTAEFSIRPITLFFGYNSAGKSAALRYLKLLADSTSGDCTSPLNLRSDALKGTDFASLLSKYSSSPSMKFGFQFDQMIVNITILDIPEKRMQVVERLEILLPNELEPSVMEWLADEDELESVHRTYQFLNMERDTELKLRFDGLVPMDFPEEFSPILKPLANSLESFGDDFFAISPDCVLPERYQIETAPAKNISSRGEGIMSMLQAASIEVIDDISKWYESATGYSFQRTQITIGDRIGHRFTLHPNADAKIDIDIVDTGEGMGQVLPVASLLTLAKHGALGDKPTISLEHPELHIHPDAHSSLADLFCQAVKSKACPRLLIETHSENLLLGLQLAIVEGRIAPSDIAVHWVRGTESGAAVDLIEFDEKARPNQNNWPVDVYRTNSKLARNLFEKRKSLEK